MPGSLGASAALRPATKLEAKQLTHGTHSLRAFAWQVLVADVSSR